MITGNSIPFKKGEGAKETCPECAGDGESSTSRGKVCHPAACETCGGSGVVSKELLKEILANDPLL